MRSNVRLAFLGDVHGNLPALEAVLADLKDQSPDHVYLLGDLVNRCPWNNEVMDRLTDEGWPSVQGNHDLIVAHLNTPQSRQPFTNARQFPIIYWTWKQLDAVHIETLRQLPAQRVIQIGGAPSIRLFHGVPHNPFLGILPETSDQEISELVDPYTDGWFVTAHTHRPLNRRVGSKQLLNPGSVGLPYNGDPRAQYLLLDLATGQKGARWIPCFRRVDYDTSVIPAAYERSGIVDEAGPLARLYMRTAMNGEPWASDFGHWLKHQNEQLRQNLDAAVDLYLSRHGPHNWAFFQKQPTNTPKNGQAEPDKRIP